MAVARTVTQGREGHKSVTHQVHRWAELPYQVEGGNPVTTCRVTKPLCHDRPVAATGKQILIFFPSNAFMASARSFNMFNSMLQLGLID